VLAALALLSSGCAYWFGPPATAGDPQIRWEPKPQVLNVEVRATIEGLDYGYVVLCTVQNDGGPGFVTVTARLHMDTESYEKTQTAHMDFGARHTFQFVFQQEVPFLRGLFASVYGLCWARP